MVRAAPRFLLDTDICIFFRMGRSKALAARLSALSFGEAVLSVVTLGELRLGAEKSVKRARNIEILNELTTLYPVEDVTPAVASDYGAIRAGLEREGRMIGSNDLWIAAHARAEGLTLVTNNEREFRRVPGLRVENWAAEEA